VIENRALCLCSRPCSCQFDFHCCLSVCHGRSASSAVSETGSTAASSETSIAQPDSAALVDSSTQGTELAAAASARKRKPVRRGRMISSARSHAVSDSRTPSQASIDTQASVQESRDSQSTQAASQFHLKPDHNNLSDCVSAGAVHAASEPPDPSLALMFADIGSVWLLPLAGLCPSQGAFLRCCALFEGSCILSVHLYWMLDSDCCCPVAMILCCVFVTRASNHHHLPPRPK